MIIAFIAQLSHYKHQKKIHQRFQSAGGFFGI
jgi:hypothetical protein